MKTSHALVIAALSIGTATFTGCASEHPSKIPDSATLRVEGSHHLTYVAPHDGVAYVYDNDTDKLVWSGGLLRGQELTVDPHNDRIQVGDRLVSETHLTTRDTYRIYFSPSAVVVPREE